MSIDEEIFFWVVEHRAGPLDPLFVGLSAIGVAGLVWIALAPLVAWRARRSVLLVTLLTATTVWTADLVTLGLKEAIDRPRPFEALPEVDPLLGGAMGSSFPSGHAATSLAGTAFLAFVHPRALPALATLAVAIAFSRVYVGVHYPADLLGGAAVGAAFGIAAGILRRRLPTA